MWSLPISLRAQSPQQATAACADSAAPVSLRIARCEAASRADAENPLVWKRLADAYYKSAMYEKARDAYGAALRRNDTDADALAGAGASVGQLGDYRAAVDYFD